MGKSLDPNRELDLAIARRAEAVSFGRLLAEEGVTTVALDAEGNMIEYSPDGTSRPLPPTPEGTAQ